MHAVGLSALDTDDIPPEVAPRVHIGRFHFSSSFWCCDTPPFIERIRDSALRG